MSQSCGQTWLCMFHVYILCIHGYVLCIYVYVLCIHVYVLYIHVYVPFSVYIPCVHILTEHGDCLFSLLVILQTVTLDNKPNYDKGRTDTRWLCMYGTLHCTVIILNVIHYTVL